MAGKFVRDWSDVIRNMPKRADSTNKRDGGDNPEWVAEVVAAAVVSMQANGLANRTKQLAKVPDFIREQERDLAESRAECRKWREKYEDAWAEVGAQSEARAFAEARAERLRRLLMDTAAVGITMLFDTHKDDVMAAFSVDELLRVVESTAHLNEGNAQVEHVYRRAWDAALSLEPTP